MQHAARPDFVKLSFVRPSFFYCSVIFGLAICFVQTSNQCVLAQDSSSQQTITIEKEEDSVLVVKTGEDIFTRFNYGNSNKPILFPVYGPGQQAMTRNYPMIKDVQGEASDHPHHKSIWFAHGDVNGLDFWSEKYKIRSADVSFKSNTITSVNEWVDGTKVIVHEVTTYSFASKNDRRYIDFSTKLTPGDGIDEITFGDTKEGTFAVRTHPALRLTGNKKQGVTTANGQALNSNGESGKSIWGKKAKWVYYWANMNPSDATKNIYGIAIFDHPDNPRHPTTWHARDYGLVAANPFGLHHFQKQPAGSGDLKVTEKQPLELRYRILIGYGQLEQSELDIEFSSFADEAK